MKKAISLFSFWFGFLGLLIIAVNYFTDFDSKNTILFDFNPFLKLRLYIEPWRACLSNGIVLKTSSSDTVTLNMYILEFITFLIYGAVFDCFKFRRLAIKAKIVHCIKNTIKRIMNVTLRGILLHTFLIALSIICIMPLYLMFINATHSTIDIAQKALILPGGELLNNLDRLFNSYINVWNGLGYSIITSLSASLLSPYFGALAAFGFAKYKFWGKKFLFAVVLASLIMPQQIAIIGFLKICNTLNIVNTVWPLIIPAIANASVVFYIRCYIKGNVPDSIMESARIDGCGEFKIFNTIILPMIIPAIAFMSLITFISSWNSFLVPLLVFSDDPHTTMPVWVGLYTKGMYANDYGIYYAFMAIATIPIIILYLYCSRYIISGNTEYWRQLLYKKEE